MDEFNSLKERELKNRITLRKVSGWILFGLGILSLVGAVMGLLATLLYLIFFGLVLSFFVPIIGVFVIIVAIVIVVIGAIVITLSILQLLAGLYMARGRNRGFVTAIVIILISIAGLNLLSSLYGFVLDISYESMGNLMGAILTAGIYGFFIFALRRTWDTFRTDETRGKAPGSVGIIYPTKGYVPRKIEDEPSIYTKDYKKQLEKERKRVKSSHEEYVSASGYDFKTISKR